jgi:5-methylcytosine-specific restriction endonuclease McrA
MARSKKPWFQKYIETRIAQVWGWCPERKKAKARAQASDGSFGCEECGRVGLSRREVEIDHIEPRKRVEGWAGWDDLIARTFVPAELLCICCKECHTRKSVAENKTRRVARGKVQDT